LKKTTSPTFQQEWMGSLKKNTCPSFHRNERKNLRP
jgi:hypothetical protein